MKKALVLSLLISLIILALVSCDGEATHTHSYDEWKIIQNPTCTEVGTEARYCGCGEKQTEIIPEIGHNYEEGKCQNCGKFDPAICEHKNVEIIPEMASTCTETGLTAGEKCADCDTILVQQGVAPTIPHSYGDWVVTKNANCGQDGEMTRYCSCGDKQTDVILGSGLHTEIIDAAVAPTCTKTGLTEGKHCAYCGTVFVAQEVVPTAEHTYGSDYLVDNSFHWLACRDCGFVKDKAEHALDAGEACTICGEPIGPTVGIVYDISADGTYAEVVAYNGSAKKIRIADTYEGLPIKTIYQKAFYDNDSITSVIIPDSVTTIGSEAFYSCSNLTSVVIGNSVTSIGDYAFQYCDDLTSVVIGDSVTSIGDYAFWNCNSLTSVVIPDSVTTIGREAFYCCSNLTSVVIGDSVTTIGYNAFSDCFKLKLNEYENGKYLGTADNPYFALLEITTKNLSSYTIHEDTKIIAGSVFSGCERLTSISIPDSVTTIGSYAFSSCSSLTSVVIGDSVTTIGDYAFSSCSSLTSVVIPDSVTTIGHAAFHSCTSLTSIVIGDSVITIGENAFYYCSSLTSVVIPDSVTTIGNWAFECCSELEDVYYTGSEEEWKAITIGSNNSYLTNATKHYNYVAEG